MAEKRHRQPNYSPEFMEKAVDLTLASLLPDKHVASLLGVNSSTLATWKSKRLKMNGSQSQENLYLEVDEDEEDDYRDAIKCNNDHFTEENEVGSEPQEETDAHESAHQILNDIFALKPEDIEHLQKENRKLKNERDILQEALIIIAGNYLRT